METEHHAAYLSGDISRRAEQALLAHLPSNVAFLLAPHHGSASSSSMPFVRQLALEVLVYSAGRTNRYGHPHPRVVRRYTWEETRQLSTGRSRSHSVVLCADGKCFVHSATGCDGAGYWLAQTCYLPGTMAASA
jgi:competence protein ComEC